MASKKKTSQQSAKASSKKSAEESVAPAVALKGFEKRLKKTVDDIAGMLADTRRAAEKAEKSAEKSEKARKKSEKAKKTAKKAAKKSTGAGPGESDATDAASSGDVAGGTDAASTSTPVIDRTTDHVTPADALPLPTADDPDVPSDAWTVVRLRDAARDKGVPGYASLRKAALIEALTAK